MNRWRTDCECAPGRSGVSRNPLLITRRSQVRILSPLYRKAWIYISGPFLVLGGSARRTLWSNLVVHVSDAWPRRRKRLVLSAVGGPARPAAGGTGGVGEVPGRRRATAIDAQLRRRRALPGDQARGPRDVRGGGPAGRPIRACASTSSETSLARHRPRRRNLHVRRDTPTSAPNGVKSNGCRGRLVPLIDQALIVFDRIRAAGYPSRS